MDIDFKKDIVEVKITFMSKITFTTFTADSRLSADSLSSANNANANVWIVTETRYTLNLLLCSHNGW